MNQEEAGGRRREQGEQEGAGGRRREQEEEG